MPPLFRYAIRPLKPILMSYPVILNTDQIAESIEESRIVSEDNIPIRQLVQELKRSNTELIALKRQELTMKKAELKMQKIQISLDEAKAEFNGCSLFYSRKAQDVLESLHD